MKPAPPVTRYRMPFTDLPRVAELNELRDDPIHRCTSQASRSGGEPPPVGCRAPATHVSRSGGYAPHSGEIVLPVRQDRQGGTHFDARGLQVARELATAIRLQPLEGPRVREHDVRHDALAPQVVRLSCDCGFGDLSGADR